MARTSAQYFSRLHLSKLIEMPICLQRSFGNNDEDDFHIVSGILRLSTKYLIDSLRAKALMHLAKAWPTDLRTWDTREDLVRHSNLSMRVRYPHPAVGLRMSSRTLTYFSCYSV